MKLLKSIIVISIAAISLGAGLVPVVASASSVHQTTIPAANPSFTCGYFGVCTYTGDHENGGVAYFPDSTIRPGTPFAFVVNINNIHYAGSARNHSGYDLWVESNQSVFKCVLPGGKVETGHVFQKGELSARSNHCNETRPP